MKIILVKVPQVVRSECPWHAAMDFREAPPASRKIFVADLGQIWPNRAFFGRSRESVECRTFRRPEKIFPKLESPLTTQQLAVQQADGLNCSATETNRYVTHPDWAGQDPLCAAYISRWWGCCVYRLSPVEQCMPRNLAISSSVRRNNGWD